jgi:hypothetical protein
MKTNPKTPPETASNVRVRCQIVRAGKDVGCATLLIIQQPDKVSMVNEVLQKLYLSGLIKKGDGVAMKSPIFKADIVISEITITPKAP